MGGGSTQVGPQGHPQQGREQELSEGQLWAETPGP